jgi:hypothetical protein
MGTLVHHAMQLKSDPVFFVSSAIGFICQNYCGTSKIHLIHQNYCNASKIVFIRQNFCDELTQKIGFICQNYCNISHIGQIGLYRGIQNWFHNGDKIIGARMYVCTYLSLEK